MSGIGPPPKPAAKRQRRNKRDVGLVAVAGSKLDAPAAPKGWLAGTKDEWTEFWSTPAAALVQAHMLPVLSRVFDLHDEIRRCMNSARSGRLVDTDKGPVLNPLYKHASTLMTEARQLEAQFGMTPMSFLRLGATFGEAKRTLADLNAEAEKEEAGGSDEDRFSVVVDAEATIS